ncbi:uncharacterized protein LOC113464923, partial [Ceratina calcarata]|uniref:Uncharacterized protein LOC113464923 n=1 Tax=Ceratina calcarata TaxID=156304 RepID=A0AAJ7WEH6_9HYME
QELQPKRRIVIDNREIVPMYDVPHLLKGIRNNLLTKDLIWVRKNEEAHATWNDIIRAYRLSSAIYIMAKNKLQDASGNIMQQRAKGTAAVLKFFDQLFDSVNGNVQKAPSLKPLKGAVT